MRLRPASRKKSARARALGPPRVGCALLAFLAFFNFTFSIDAADAPLTGQWSASTLRVSWSVGDWGKSCGPRPSGGAESGGLVTITARGAGFSLSGLGRNYQSGQCWEQMPGLTPRSRSSSKNAIVATCSMPPGDPRQARVVTSWYPRGDEIYFDETGQYQFVVSGSNCTASVRRTRKLTRVQSAEPEPEELGADADAERPTNPPPPSPKATGTATRPGVVDSADRPPEPRRAERCSQVGEPTQLEVSPKSKLMRPGERFSFSAIARDARGCRVPVKTRWALLDQGPVALDARGRVAVPNDVKSGRYRLQARVGKSTVTVTARVVSDAEYERLLQGGDYGVFGESLDSAEVELTSHHVELAESSQADDDGKSTVLWVLGGLVAVLALTMAWVLGRARSAPVISDDGSNEAARPEAISPGNPANSASERPDALVSSSPHRDSAAPLPDLRTGNEPERSRRAHLPEAPREGSSLRRLCPLCGRRYAEGTQFCGDDGARLMRVN